MSAAATTELVNTRPTLTQVAADLTPQQREWESQTDLIKKTVAPGLTDDEMSLFLYVCRKRNLDPLARQIYAIKRRQKDGSSKMTIQTGVDGFRAIAERSGLYAGSDEPIFEGTFEGTHYPEVCKVTVYKVVAGIRCPFTGVATWREFFPPFENEQFMWKRFSRHMLSKCAEVHALRKAFPEEMLNIRVHEEMSRYGAIDIDPVTGEIVQHQSGPHAVIAPNQDGYDRETTPERTHVTTGEETANDDAAEAFGHTFASWPDNSWFDAVQTPKQTQQIGIKCTEKKIPEVIRKPLVWAIANAAAGLGEEPTDWQAWSTKDLNRGQASLVIDFLIGADAKAMAAAIDAANRLLLND